MKGILLLEDGRVFEGQGFGATTSKVGEVVFNTAMTGYQEALTDPSYCEQILLMTYPHIGNTGVNDDDPESARVWVNGFIAKRFTQKPSNHRSEKPLEQYLIEQNTPALQGIDTRALVRHIRTKGAMKGVISTDGSTVEELQQQLQQWPGMEGRALATEVCTSESFSLPSPAHPRARVNLIDGGCKKNILRLLLQANCQVRVVPITAKREDWIKDCDFIFLSNGPGDPAALREPINTLSSIIGHKPIVGICLGHQLLALALGAKTYKLRFGHRGANHPVLDVETNRVEITSQNHGFCVDEKSLVEIGACVTHINLNDQTVAGLRHEEKRVLGVQFHPEACPGPHDSAHLVLERYLQFAMSKTT
jgi:carbamoyl-phosphate synthase small subunit